MALTLIAGTAQAQSQGQSSQWWDQNRTTPPAQTTQPPARNAQLPPTASQSAPRQDEISISNPPSTYQSETSRAPASSSTRLRLAPSYSWVQLGFISWITNHDYYEDTTGLKLSTSTELGQNFYLQTRIEKPLVDDELNEIDETRFQLGMGFHQQWFPRTDWHIEGGILHINGKYQEITLDYWGNIIDIETKSASVTGSYVALGFRSRVSRILELWEEQRVYIVDGSNTTSVTGGLYLRFAPRVGFAASMEFLNNWGRLENRVLVFDVGVRIMF